MPKDQVNVDLLAFSRSFKANVSLLGTKGSAEMLKVPKRAR